MIKYEKRAGSETMQYVGMFFKKFFRFLLKPFSFAPALIVMYMITSFSAQNGVASSEISGQVSDGIVAMVNEKLNLGFNEEQVKEFSGKIEYYVRKLAHVTEYFILAVSVAFPLYVYGLRGIPLVLIAGVFCVGFAGLDEYHQSFVAGRNPSKRDVLIDSIGVIMGITVTRIIGFVGRKTIFRPLANRKREQ